MNRYDLAFDAPEAHTIRRNGKVCYAFYAGAVAQRYHGPIALRGLEAQAYRVHDYVNDRELGEVHGPEAVFEVMFSGALLIEVIPQ